MWTTCPERRPRPPARRRATGFTLVAVLFVLVVLAALGAALSVLAQRQAIGSAATLASAHALQAARAGLEWGAWQVLRNPAPPAAAPACPAGASFQPAGSDFTVTVQCTRTPGTGTVNDGETELVFFQFEATACNAPTAGACPATGVPRRSYVERQLSWTLVR